MRIVLLVLGLIAFGIILAAIWFRLVPMSDATWHVEPAEAVPPASPNFELRVGERAPVFDAPPDVIAARLDAVATAEGADLLAGSLADGHMTYVARSRIMGFPDAVSIRLVPVGEGTRVEIFSRSRFGYSDLGVNMARVERWIAAVRAQTGP